MNWMYVEAKKRLQEENVNTDGKYILVDGHIFDGESLTGIKYSEDMRWVCIPVEDEEATEIYGQGKCYRP